MKIRVAGETVALIRIVTMLRAVKLPVHNSCDACNLELHSLLHNVSQLLAVAMPHNVESSNTCISPRARCPCQGMGCVVTLSGMGPGAPCVN